MNDNPMVDLLLVEDNPQDLELALRALHKANISLHIEVARDGVEALDFVFKKDPSAESSIGQSPKVILLDLKLPKLDGLEVLKRLKDDVRSRSIPIVVLTSSREQSDLLESYRLGVNSFVVKPVQFEQFCTLVRNLGRYWLVLNQAPKVAD